MRRIKDNPKREKNVDLYEVKLLPCPYTHGKGKVSCFKIKELMA